MHRIFCSVVSALIIILGRSTLNTTLDGVDLCKFNCNSTLRLVGPTQPQHTRPHPWIKAPPKAKSPEFCRLGCQLFFTELPWTVECKNNCAWFYRFSGTDEYSDLAVKAQLECSDGCEIGYKVCQKGFYCSMERLIPCSAGHFRGAYGNETSSICKKCPYGTYRATTLGTNENDCTKCPIGKYLDALGSTMATDCKRCPAGKWSDVEGMRYCTCIDAASCDMPITTLTSNGPVTTHYFNDSIDFYRETVPYIGRW